MDWNSTTPNGSTVAIAVVKRPAKVLVTNPRYDGPILVNPGGPGGSGVDFAIASSENMQIILDSDSLSVPSEDLKFFDVISWDP